MKDKNREWTIAFMAIGEIFKYILAIQGVLVIAVIIYALIMNFVY